MRQLLYKVYYTTAYHILLIILTSTALLLPIRTYTKILHFFIILFLWLQLSLFEFFPARENFTSGTSEFKRVQKGLRDLVKTFCRVLICIKTLKFTRKTLSKRTYWFVKQTRITWISWSFDQVLSFFKAHCWFKYQFCIMCWSLDFEHSAPSTPPPILLSCWGILRGTLLEELVIDTWNFVRKASEPLLWLKRLTIDLEHIFCKFPKLAVIKYKRPIFAMLNYLVWRSFIQTL